ncbi:MAG TPA: helicase-exonuclease AddAB subunit AddA [Oscillospiraceae bacterium]|nr:helicase-exonuclease AddAB subunit AddA [Oscillospiraceae bacterium]
MSKQWTAEQLAAIETGGCNLLVAAAAGSGKTAVLVERIIRLLCRSEAPLDIDKLLVVTFTEAAAAEMRERIAAALEREISTARRLDLVKQLSLLNGASISTLHSFCLEVIQRYFYLLELDPSFRVADELEASMLRQEIVALVLEKAFAEEDEDFLALARHYGGRTSDEGLVSLILQLYRFCWSNPWPERWLDEAVNLYALNAEADPESALGVWLNPLREELHLTLEQAADTLHEALALCQLPQGPLVYEAALQKELEQVKSLLTLLGGPWSELREAWLAVTFDRLRAAKDVDEKLKTRVKALRDGAKDLLKKSSITYFTRSLSEYVSEITALAPLLSSLVKQVKEFAHAYATAKKQAGLMDFNDLEHYCLQILLANEADAASLQPSAAALELRARYAQVLVDEYQDINPVQDAILQLVSRQGEEAPNLFMVGDVKQSIYRFRLGDPGLFLDKYNRYAVNNDKVDSTERKILLSRNFRCRTNVVATVNYLFSQLMTAQAMEIEYDQEAELVCGATYPVAADIKLIEEAVEVFLLEKDIAANSLASAEADAEEEDLTSLEREGVVVAQQIQQLVRKQGSATHIFDKDNGCYRPVSYRDIVILLRSTSNRASRLAAILARYNIPAYAELTTGYFAATEVETMLSLLQVLNNPCQDIPLAAVLRSPFVSFSAEQLAAIRQVGGRNCDFWQALLTAAQAELPELSLRCQAFLQQLDRWRDLARREKLGTLLATIYRESGYADYVAGMPDGMKRQANLRALFSRARQFDRFSRQGLSRFLQFIEQLRKSGEDLGAARALGENEDVVRIMSIHKAKGLEFPIVFLSDLGKSFNFQDQRAELLLHRHLGLAPLIVEPEAKLRYPSLPYLALRLVGEAETRAEELRILYVALTRAREKLYLVGSVKKLTETMDTWGELVSCPTKQLPSYHVRRARTYLDWLGKALSRHPQIKAANSARGWQPAIEAHLKLTCVEQVEADFDLASQAQEADCKQALLTLSPLPVETPVDVKKAIKERLCYQYPYPPSSVPAKLSVTEIKRRFAQAEEEEGEAHRLITSPWPRPNFIQKQGLTPVERGLLYHSLLQHLDLTQPLDEAGIVEQIRQLVQAGILAEMFLSYLDPAKVTAFFRSEAGQLMLTYKEQVLREWPFTYALPAAELAAEEHETVLIQGIIDVLVSTPEGFVIIDYKTDRLPTEGMAELAKRYQVQLAYYARAVETILHEPVQAAYLYAFAADRAVRVL